MDEEKLRGAKFRHGSMMEEEVHFCEPKQGSFLREDDDEDVEGRFA
jgi:hypothetical protein